MWAINDKFLYIYSNAHSRRSPSMLSCTQTFSRPRKASSSSPHRMLLLWIVRANGPMGRLAEDKRLDFSFNLNVILWSTRRAHDRLTKTANCLLWWVRKSAVSYKSTEKETMWQTCWNIVNFSNVYSIYSCHDVMNQRAGNFNQFEVCDDNELTVTLEWAWWGFIAHDIIKKDLIFQKNASQLMRK